jgi:Ca-activated chloride channel family protein
VDQVFANSSDQDLEAVYSFPLPKEASLSELSLWIDGHEVLGEVVEKARARRVYEEQKAQGNETALAEKDDYKTFDIKVGKIPAQAETRVRLVYYQPLELDLGVGRYLYPLAEGNVDDLRPAFWSLDDRVEGTFSFHLVLKSAFPVKDVRLPGYGNQASVQRVESIADGGSGDVYEVTVTSEQGANLSADVIFYYRLDDDVPARLELVPYREDPSNPGTFMVVVTPAASLQRIEEGADWIFVLDVSGSMGGHKIATLADGVSRVLGKMGTNDRFGIVTFNNQGHDLTGGLVTASAENVSTWLERLKGLQAGGGTNLFAGLEKAYRHMDRDRTAGVVLVTDGVANVGPTQHAAFLKLAQNYDIRLFTFVIGNSANQPLMDRLAKASGGFAMNLSDADDIAGRLIQARAKITHECLHDLELVFHGERVGEITPPRIGNLYLGQQLVVFGRYQESGEVEVELRAKVSGEQKSWTTRATLPETDVDNPEIERLWALSAIEDQMVLIRELGESAGLRDQVVALGTEYSLVTDYTSMVVLREDVMEDEGIQRRNAQRVQRERQAQQTRAQAPVRNHRVDGTGVKVGPSQPAPQAPAPDRAKTPAKRKGMFDGMRAPSIGSGAVGPLFVGLVVWLHRRKRSRS